ncbi:hypothetical protein VTJ04DRAFT_7416 [Mycothermus thermophilus]|uniref:uncharacterized protein n=1 Tax=Humicola insolens TaxID=85995 RepID=UPI003742282D
MIVPFPATPDLERLACLVVFFFGSVYILCSSSTPSSLSDRHYLKAYKITGDAWRVEDRQHASVLGPADLGQRRQWWCGMMGVGVGWTLFSTSITFLPCQVSQTKRGDRIVALDTLFLRKYLLICGGKVE